MNDLKDWLGGINLIRPIEKVEVVDGVARMVGKAGETIGYMSVDTVEEILAEEE